MKHFDYLVENINRNIDDQWINDEKPVCTLDGRKVKIYNVDISVVPNKIIGVVIVNNKQLDYEWSDDGTCISASDNLGNPCKPSENDKLIKQL